MQLRGQEKIAYTSCVQREITMPYGALRGQVWPGEELMPGRTKMLVARYRHADSII
jgi:hypothetical protein